MPAHNDSDRIEDREKERVQTEEREERPFPIVGIGASAGGLEALKPLVESIHPEEKAAFAVIQHMSPDKASYLCDLLGRETSLRVKTMEEGMEIEPGHVYCNPPGKDIDVYHGVFRLTDQPATRAKISLIDHFFRSLAEDRGPDAIAVILSGTGTDGTQGIKEIKGRGGIVLAQDPEQAKYTGMPKSAIATGLVDEVLPVEKMVQRLSGFIRHPYFTGALEPAADEEGKDRFEEHVQKILMLLRSRTGNDFADYKRNTVCRRIQRRMAVHQITDPAHYLRYLQENGEEVEKLFSEMLIRVSSFFREPDAFEGLSQKVLPVLIERKDPSSTLRIWVPGCSTGEEAYSLGILVVEAMERCAKSVKVQIFATDIDGESIDHARAGRYPGSIREDVSEERLERFFTYEDDSWVVGQELRDMIVFAVQNLVSQPPFSKIDLVSCRNLLIYLGPKLQKRVLPLFHYILNPEGYLFLGSSETIGEFTQLFSTVDRKARIFQRKERDASESKYPPPYEFDFRRGHEGRAREGEGQGHMNVGRIAERIMRSDFVPPYVLVNKDLDIVYSRNASRYLKLPEGNPSLNILSMAREDIRPPMKDALDEVRKQKRRIATEKPDLESRQENLSLQLVVKAIRPPAVTEEMILVIFREKEPPESPEKEHETPGEREEDPRVHALKDELYSTRAELESTVAELQASNEELQSSNEEAQSTNEELETSREELQATNEELSTVNSQLQEKVEELSKSKDDMKNLLASTDIGTVFLDRDLKIKQFTPPITRVLSLRETDLGRPLSDINSKIPHADLDALAREVLGNLEPKELEAQTRDETWYSVRIRPYRTREDVIGGIVITFVDINKLKKSESARIYAESVIDTLREAVLVLDEDLKVKLANRSFYRMFMASPGETINHRIYDLGNGQWDIPRLRGVLEEVIPTARSFEDFRVDHDFPDIGHKKMRLNARMVRQEGEARNLILLAIEDLSRQGIETEQKVENGE